MDKSKSKSKSINQNQNQNQRDIKLSLHNNLNAGSRHFYTKIQTLFYSQFLSRTVAYNCIKCPTGI